MYMVGDLVFYGLVNIITRAGDFSSVMLPDHAVRLNYTIARSGKVVPVARLFHPRDEAIKNSRFQEHTLLEP